MLHRRSFTCAAGALTVATLAGCAAMPGRDPVQVQVAGVEPLTGEGLELRFLVKLRVQNPNDAPIEYNGLFIELDINGSSFATGVSDAAGTVPRFGETVLQIPVAASAMRLVRQAIGFFTQQGELREVDYELRGKISGPLFSSVRFASKGKLELPGSAGAPAPQ